MHRVTPPSPDHSAHVIAIDGPAGAGKSTVARMLAKRLGWFHLDTGATYRAMAAAALMNGIKPDDTEALCALAEKVKIEVISAAESYTILADGVDVTTIIRSPDVGKASSPVSAVPAVRERLVALQRELAAGKNTVAEGRDMGTTVFPAARLKIYLTASAEERARRRALDFASQNCIVPEEQVLEEIRERDLRDSTRDHSPLRPAEDAYIIETDNLSPEEIVDRIISYYVDATL